MDDLTRHEFNSALAAPQKGEEEEKTKEKRNKLKNREPFQRRGLKGMKKQNNNTTKNSYSIRIASILNLSRQEERENRAAARLASSN